MKYELVLLDADGTLFDYDRAEEYALENTYKHFKYEYNPSSLECYRKINKYMWKELELGNISKELLRTERFKKLFNFFDISGDEENFSNIYLNYLSKSDFLIEGAEELCRYLYNRCKIAIVTNGIKEVQISRLKSSSLEQYIENIIISGEVGSHKPEPEIFEYALNKLNYYDKDKTIIIGDSLSSDILGGNNFGIDTCWFNKSGKKSKDIVPTYEIKELSEVKQIL